jgi:hypothetical protein
MSNSASFRADRVGVFMRRWPAAAAVALLACGLIPTAAGAATGPVDWSQSAAVGPTPSVQPYLSYDTARNRAVLFGGAPTTNGAYYSDTWEFDGSSWSKIAVAGPSGRALGQMVYDSARGVSVLFGGSSGAANLSETWEWNGSSWTQRATASAPAPRLWFGMTYDSKRLRTVLFGGSTSGNSNLADTWEYDGTNWSQVATAHTPPGRFGEGLAFDSARNRVVMFGGHAANRLNDTWEYDGTDWTQVATATSPAPRFWHTMGYDPSRQRTVVFGGDYQTTTTLGPNNETWEYDGVNWSQLLTTSRPSPRVMAPMAYLSALGKLALYGGSDESGRPDVALGDTWLLGSAQTSPGAALSVSSITFPQQPVLTAATQPVTLSNSGNAPLTITSISGSGDFGATDACPRSPATLAAGSSCSITVSFTPTTGTGQVAGSLTLLDDAGTGTQSIPLAGSGAWGFLNVSPSPIDFGSNQINTNNGATAAAIATLSAPAQATVITGVETTGPFHAVNLDCPLNTPLSSGAACRVQVGFFPPAPGTYSGQLVIHDNEAGLQRLVALSAVAFAQPVSIQVQLTYEPPVYQPTVAHVLHILATTDAASGQATFTFGGKQVAGPIELTSGYATIALALDDSVIPAGAGSYPLQISVHSTDPSRSDASITQQVTVVPETVTVAWKGTTLGVAGNLASLSVQLDPAAGDSHFVDFNTHPLWARFDLTGPDAKTSVFYARVTDLVQASGFFGQGVASVKGPVLAAGAYQVRVRLVDSAQSASPSHFAGSEDLRTAFAAHRASGGWLAGVGQGSSSLAFEFTDGTVPTGSLVWVYPTQVVGADGLWHDAYRVYHSTSVQSANNQNGTAVITGRVAGAIYDANTGQSYPAFEVATTFKLKTQPSGNAELNTGNSDYFSGSLKPVGVINRL